MKQVLQINSSIYGIDAASTRLATAFATKLANNHGASLIQRDLSLGEIPHLSASTHQAFALEASEYSAEQQQSIALSDALIKELKDSDEIVLAVPLYNFGIPSELKAWIDHVARAGVTFQYTSNGPEGLLKNKHVTVIATRGGQYAGSDADTQTPYLKQVLGFLGLTDVDFVYAEGLAMAEKREPAIVAANEKLQALAA
jgi:FMN-dependent NADH-azoreductase